MYNDQWDRICYSEICVCIKKTLQSEKIIIIIIWEEWMKMCSCYTLTERTEFALFTTVMRVH